MDANSVGIVMPRVGDIRDAHSTLLKWPGTGHNLLCLGAAFLETIQCFSIDKTTNKFSE
jgi:hypothetical protein